MPVIAGHGAEEAQLSLLAPGLTAAVDAQHQRLDEAVVHQAETGLAAHDDVLHGHTQDLAEELLGLVHAGQLSVVAHVGAFAAVDQVVGVLGQHIHAEIQLGGVGLAAGHVELETAGLDLLVFGHERVNLMLQLLTGHVEIRIHVGNLA